MPESEARQIDLSVEDAFKVIMSAGLVTPDTSSGQESLPGLEMDANSPPEAEETPGP